jgi:hypothetical protein
MGIMFDDPLWDKFNKLKSIVNHTKKHGSQVVCVENRPGEILDIGIKFSMKSYDFYVLIRCVNKPEIFKIEDLNRFEKEYADFPADKLIIVTKNVIDEAVKSFPSNKDIEFYELSEIMKLQEEPFSQILCPRLRIYNIQFLLSENNEWIVLPEDKNLPEYLQENLVVHYETKSMILAELIQGFHPTLLKNVTNEEKQYEHNFRVQTKVDFPHLSEQHEVIKISFSYKIVSVQGFIVTSNFDPFIEEKMNIQNLTDSQDTFDTLVEEGKFYYCSSVNKESFTLICLESYQHGSLFQSSATLTIESQKHYVEITDDIEIARLKKIGRDFLLQIGIFGLWKST